MILLDTAEIPADERPEAFRSALVSASVPSLVAVEDTGGRLYARMDVWRFGEATLFTSASSGWSVARSSRYLRLEGPPIVALSLQARGTGRFGQSGRQERVAEGELIANDLTIPYDYAWSGAGVAQAGRRPRSCCGRYSPRRPEWTPTRGPPWPRPCSSGSSPTYGRT